MDEKHSPKHQSHPTILNREVVVVMPFGGDCCPEREAILHFMRLKHIVEKHINVTNLLNSDDPGIDVRYHVSVAHTEVGDIPEESLEKIVAAEIVIAMITNVNANVIYELAVRNLMKQETLMIVKGDSRKILPIYVQSMAYIEYDNTKFDAVSKTISTIAEDEAHYGLSWSELSEIPEELIVAIEHKDQALIRTIERAFFKLETKPPQLPNALRKFASQTAPYNLLNSWVTYIPWSIMRICWSKRSGRHRYHDGDMRGEPVVCTSNEEFLQLFDQGGGVPDPDGDHPLTFSDMLSHVKPFFESHKYKKFEDDQSHLVQKIIYQGRNGVAKVPMEFNSEHTNPAYRNKCYLPCLVGKLRVGDINVPHTTYLLINYIEDFWPVDHHDDMGHNPTISREPAISTAVAGSPSR